jgi:hypothetical protein
MDTNAAAAALARHALATAKKTTEMASPYLLQTLGVSGGSVSQKDLAEVRRKAAALVGAATESMRDSIPSDWLEVLAHMAGDLTSREWAEKIGCSKDLVAHECRKLGVAPQGRRLP